MLLEVTNLAVAYGDVRAVWDISLHVDRGEIVGLIGSNGAGKTTLMRALAGLQRPLAGSIAFAGARLDALPPHEIVERGVVLVPEGRRLFGGMSVLENLELGAFTPRARQERARTIKRVFEIFPWLAERRYQRAQTMSGGEQQMLAIGRAIKGEGVTVLLVEQNARAALELADRAYIVEGGRVVGTGAGAALLHDEAVRQAYLGYAPDSA